jgi:hypothetical protein
VRNATDTGKKITLVTGKLDKEPNSSRHLSFVQSRGPIDDVDKRHRRDGRGHCSHQLFLAEREILESHDHAGDMLVSESMLGIYERSLAALNEFHDGNTICWVKPGDLDHISHTITP